MEPTFFDMTVKVLMLAYLGPFLAFSFGVYICDQMKLHSMKKRKHLWLVSVPVALLTVGMMVSSTKVQSAENSMISFRYAHVTQFDQYLMFLAVAMFFGTMAPTSFDRMRDKIMKTSAPPSVA